MKNVVIAGAGHAAGQLVATLRQKKFPGRISLIGEESWFPYQRPPLSKKYLAGEMPAERLYFKPESFYAEPNIDVQLNTRIAAIDPASRKVHSEDGTTFDYSHLVLATGSRPRELGLFGAELTGVHYLRSIDDVNQIRAAMEGHRRIVIIGAGYIGLEVAAVTARLGHDVTVVELAERVMSRVVSPELSRYYQDVHTANGVKFKLGTGVRDLSGKQHVEVVNLDSDESLPADIVIVGIGIVPNTELASLAGLEVANGIVVNDHCQTSDANIYAVGDCTWHPNTLLDTELRLESVHNALEQAKTAAGNICGEDLSYAQVPWFWSDQYDLKLQIAGLSQGYDDIVIRGDMQQHSFACLYLRKGQLIAVDAVNRPKDFIQSKPLIASKVIIDPLLLADSTVDLNALA